MDEYQLNLSNKKLRELPNNFSSNIKVFIARDNYLTYIPDMLFEHLPLEYLDLSGNEFKELPNHFDKLKNLKEINLSINYLKNINPSIYNLVDLRKLTLTFNEIEYIDDSIAQMILLRQLYLNWNELKGISSNISKLINLEVLSLTHNPDLKIDNLDLSKTNLKIIDLTRIKSGLLNEYPKLPINLKKFIYNFNKGCQFADNFFDPYHELEYLELAGNNLKKIPESISNLILLKSLHIYGNCLEELNFNDLSHLESLNISDNHFKKLPDKIFKCKSLKYLNAADNKITKLPDVLLDNNSLSDLDCSWNMLDYFPEIKENQGKSLYKINLSNNLLKKIPDNFHYLENLNYLNVASNQIIKLPDNITRCKKLKKINYEENPNILISDALLDYFESQFYYDSSTGQFISVYDDAQNTHRQSIRDSIKKIISILRKDDNNFTLERMIQMFKKPEQKDNMMKYLTLNDKMKIYHMPLVEIICRVWNRIGKFPKREGRAEMIRLFHDEIKNNLVYCYSRRVGGIVSVLQGYYPEITIRISDREQVANIASYIVSNKPEREWLREFRNRMEELEIAAHLREEYEAVIIERLNQ